MYLNNRVKSHELLFFNALEKRADLTKQEKLKYTAIKKGYEGECLYDKILDEVGHNNIYIYRDLYLKIGDSITQYDTLIINDDGIVVNEVKNFSGNYQYNNERWYMGNYEVPDDPFSQVNRAVGKLVRLKNSSRSEFNVTGKVIFPNDDFRLSTDEQSVWNKIVTRMDLRRYFRYFNSSVIGNKAQYISSLINSHIVENPYFKGEVENSRLRKGLYCGQCGSYNLIKGRFHLICKNCSSKETNETHLLRALSDYKFLFYNQPMTRNSFLTFIGAEIHFKTVTRSLLKHCYVNKNGNATTYIFKYFNFEDAMKKSEVYKKYKDYLK